MVTYTRSVTQSVTRARFCIGLAEANNALAAIRNSDDFILSSVDRLYTS